MLFGVSELLNFENRISDRDRQVENTNLHCLSYTMYYAVAQDLRSHKHLHSSSCKNTDRILVGLKVVDQYDRSRISRFPQSMYRPYANARRTFPSWFGTSPNSLHAT